jgi:putative Holliday junction resolvase
VDGTDTILTPVVQAFARELASRCKLPVALVDERYSSREAEQALKSARRSGLQNRRVTHADVDRVAAKLLLERWFEEQG